MKASMLAMFVTLAIAGCGSDAPPPPQCTGTSCVCPPNTSCDISASDCSGGSCTLACSMGNTCTGTCGESCSISCAGASDCDVTVGASGSVSCGADSDCTVRCTGSCSFSCAAGATCMLQCAGDSAPHTVVEGGTCV